MLAAHAILDDFSNRVHHLVVQQCLETFKAAGVIDCLENAHIHIRLSTKAEKLRHAYRSLALTEHWRQQESQKVCKT